MQGQVPNIPKPRLCALLRDLVAPALLARCESLGIGVSSVAWCKQMIQADWGCSAGGLVRLRLGQEGATAGARCLHGQDQESLLWKKYTVSDAAFFLREPPKDLVELHNVNGTWQVASNLYPDWRDGISSQNCWASTASCSSSRRTGFWRT